MPAATDHRSAEDSVHDVDRLAGNLDVGLGDDLDIGAGVGHADRGQQKAGGCSVTPHASPRVCTLAISYTSKPAARDEALR